MQTVLVSWDNGSEPESGHPKSILVQQDHHISLVKVEILKGLKETNEVYFALPEMMQTCSALRYPPTPLQTRARRRRNINFTINSACEQS